MDSMTYVVLKAKFETLMAEFPFLAELPEAGRIREILSSIPVERMNEVLSVDDSGDVHKFDVAAAPQLPVVIPPHALRCYA